MDETKKCIKTLWIICDIVASVNPSYNILCCMRYYNPHFRCVCARPDRYSPLSPANVCFLMQRVLHSFSVSSSFNISTWQWLFKRRPPGGDEEGVVGKKNELKTYICGFVKNFGVRVQLLLFVWGWNFILKHLCYYHLSSKATVSDLSPLNSIKGRWVFPNTVLLFIRTCLQ